MIFVGRDPSVSCSTRRTRSSGSLLPVQMHNLAEMPSGLSWGTSMEGEIFSVFDKVCNNTKSMLFVFSIVYIGIKMHWFQLQTFPVVPISPPHLHTWIGTVVVVGKVTRHPWDTLLLYCVLMQCVQNLHCTLYLEWCIGACIGAKHRD